jgi:hypothetical protein
MAIMVPNNMAAPTPWRARKKISIPTEEEIPKKKEAMVNIHVPWINILFLPYISAALPRGTRNTAAVKVKATTTQLNKIASAANSFPIDGKATFTTDDARAERNADMVVAIKTALLFFSLYSWSIAKDISPDYWF